MEHVTYGERHAEALAAKIQAFADLVAAQTFHARRLDYFRTCQAQGHPEDPQMIEFWRKDSAATVRPGKKWTKIDVGTSGRFMVGDAGIIFGIKGYGVPNLKKQYGTLDTIHDYFWGLYGAPYLIDKARAGFYAGPPIPCAPLPPALDRRK